MLRSQIDAIRYAGLALATVLTVSVIYAAPQGARPPVKPGSQTRPTVATPTFERDVRPLVVKYCGACHGEKDPALGLSLMGDKTAATAKSHAERWERVLKQISAGSMPPKGMPAPTATERARMVQALNALILGDCDLSDAGRVTLRRLNRAEYNNTIRDLVGVDFRPADDFPSDDVGNGFDNIGDVLSLSPLLMEKYLNAAERISEMVVEIPRPPRRVAGSEMAISGGGMPSGDTAGLYSEGVATAKFHVDRPGRYTIRVEAFGSFAGNGWPNMEVSVNGKPVQAFTVDAPQAQAKTFAVSVRLDSGEATVGCGFTNDFFDEKAPAGQQDRNLAVRSVELAPVDGGSSETYRRIVPAPPVVGKERDTARSALRAFATRAYRRPVTDSELTRLLMIYDMAIQAHEPFERGIQLGMQAVLVSPNFLFRVETDPKSPSGSRALNGYELASRLSYFLWSSMPDDRLRTLGGQGKLGDPKVMQAEVLRMIKDPRSAALADNFAEQWLQLRRLDSFFPNPKQFPGVNQALKADMKTETKQFFSSVLQNNASVLDFLDGKYTYLNGALARHYGIGGVEGKEFRRVELTGNQRGGVLSQASILAITSNPTRTSPVKRGKWVLENILGTPPPPPPPGVGDLGDDQKHLLSAKSLRERMEQHRNKPDCFSCHSKMDPIGFGMENYDAVGRWRTQDDGSEIDNSGVLPDGRKFRGPAQLKQILLQNREQFVHTLADRMLTYALGRGISVKDRCFVDEVAQKTTRDNYRFVTMIQAVVQSEPFRMRSTR